MVGGGLGEVVLVSVIPVFEFDWWDHADLAVYPSMVVPVDPFEGGQLDVVESAPGAVSADEFGLERPWNDSAMALTLL